MDKAYVLLTRLKYVPKGAGYIQQIFRQGDNFCDFILIRFSERKPK